ncbi:Transcription initiation factor TFIID, subunit TAF5 (also component of histone acetyltransferase SAGA) [Ceraceosorus bombacis]|uniref:Transcription initiation factor TFIID, subunit TAF5 (Also component of histone acetyltransferase SAGA) n=1 Tax=Ceraceosorus bombacis TaxID=401625 RepID=A0A0P1BED1_9BASI|nr:Transcription initiation factor TFIID, subunit TAF5 (also component of histone acetyltransferase SAGA) [Ceraceosorus bombacis]
MSGPSGSSANALAGAASRPLASAAGPSNGPSLETGNANGSTSTINPMSNVPSSEGPSVTANGAPPPTELEIDRMTAGSVHNFLAARGYNKALAALQSELSSADAATTVGVAGGAISIGELAAKNAPRDVTRGASGPGAEEKHATEMLKQDFSDKERGFQNLRWWCEGSLDVYRPELLPLLLPIFVHSYLDLVHSGNGNAAASLYKHSSDLFQPSQASLLSRLRAISLPSHVLSDGLAQRFRSERYVLKMSSTVFALLLGWLTDGSGPVQPSNQLDEGDPDERGRKSVLRILNERCRIQVLNVAAQELARLRLEEGTGLTGAGPSYSIDDNQPTQKSLLSNHLSSAAVGNSDVVADFNAAAAGPQLKLGPEIPLSERLAEEVQRQDKAEQKKEQEEAEKKRNGSPKNEAQLGETPMEGVEEGRGAAHSPRQADGESRDISSAAPASRARSTATPARGGTAAATVRAETVAPSGQVASTAQKSDLIQPQYADLPPQAPLFRSVDVEREVARMRDARKAIRFGPIAEAQIKEENLNAAEGPAPRIATLPSICAYTYHDAEDGLACSTFSIDSSLMAAGFEDSYVQVWSLKGEPLQPLQGNIDLTKVSDSKSLRKQRQRTSLTTRRLVGHSGPVYGVSFDPVNGTAGAPKHLLSCSADGSARLWSLDTYSALVAYRGHQLPVWDIEWGPMGVYFATSSADRTARLWNTERIHPLRMYAGHLSDVDCLRFHPNSLYLATGSSDRTCRLWDVQRGACVRLFVGHSSPVSSVRISPDGRYLASAGAGSALGPSRAPSSFGFNARNGVSSDDDDCSISLWDLGSGKRIKKMWGHSACINDIDFTKDSRLLISAAADCTVKVWDVTAAGGAGIGASGHGASAAVVADGTGGSLPSGAAAAVSAVVNSNGLETARPNAADHPFGSATCSSDLLSTFYTKKTPIIDVQVTPRNLVLCSGPYDASI